jgi:spermidine/putrescine transport system substrate-binding protein
MLDGSHQRLVGRREFLRGVTAAGLFLAVPGLLAACADPRQADRLSFLNWQDYIDDTLLADFTTRTGISITYETYASNDELARRLAQAQRAREGGRSGTSFDLIVPSDNFVTRFIDSGALRELDHDLIEGLENLDPAMHSAEFDPENRYSVPWATGTTGIGYDTRVFAEPPGYDVFLDAAYAGRTTVLAEIRDAFALALFSLGEDPNTVDPALIQTAGDLLIEMKGLIGGFDSTDYLDGLASGDLVAAHAYSSDVLQAREQNPNLAYVLPAQGALRWVDSLVIPVDAPRPANSHRLISFYLEPEVAAANSNFVKVDTGNAAARDLLPDEILDDPAIFPPDSTLDALFFTVDLGEDEELYETEWERVQEA